MKIAILFDNFGPYHLARLRAAAKTCNLLAVQVHGRSRDYHWEPSSPPFSFRSITLNHQQGEGYPGTCRSNPRLRHALSTFGPDCVFVPGWSRTYALSALLWCRANDVPAVLMSESGEHDAPRSFWKEFIKARLLWFFSAALVGGSAHVKYLVKLGMSTSQVFQGYDVVDNEFFMKSTEAVRRNSIDLRHSLGLPARYFLASARFIPQKNLSVLINAYAQYRGKFGQLLPGPDRIKSDEPWSLVLLGDGPERNAIQQLISEHGLDSFVLLPGFQQYGDLPVYYGLARAFVHVSTSEPWGLVINEAMASRLPVLVSNHCGCASDLVCEGRNGFTFDPTNAEQLAELMFRISISDALLTSMGIASLKQISKWGPDRFALGFEAAARKAGETVQKNCCYRRRSSQSVPLRQ